jgi:hypothetical protein
VARLIRLFTEQQGRVSVFFASGSLAFEQEDREQKADLLVFANRIPFRVKLELTHAWGRPLFHLLLEGTRIQILSFSEKRLYVGHLSALDRWAFMPRAMTPDHLWPMLRAYPSLRSHHRAASFQGHRISLLDSEGRALQVIDVYPDTDLPHRVTFPEQSLSLTYSRYQQEEGIRYAREVRARDRKTETALVLKLKQVVFNQTPPAPVFSLTVPQEFEIHPLERLKRLSGEGDPNPQ